MSQILLAALTWIKELIIVLLRGIRRYFTVSNILDENTALKAKNKDLQAKQTDLQAEIDVLHKEKQELKNIRHSKTPPVETKFDPRREPDDN